MYEKGIVAFEELLTALVMEYGEALGDVDIEVRVRSGWVDVKIMGA